MFNHFNGRVLLALMTVVSPTSFAVVEDFSTGTWGHHEDIGQEIIINELKVTIPASGSMKGVTNPHAIQPGYDPGKVTRSLSIKPADSNERISLNSISLTDLFQMPIPEVKLTGLRGGVIVAQNTAGPLWNNNGGITVLLNNFKNLDELKISSNVMDETDSDIFFFLESVDYATLPLDTDGDGLADVLEDILGTNPNSVDTDNDGLSDYDEINYDGDDTAYNSAADTDPLNPDTDNDGILDGADSDPLVAATQVPMPFWSQIIFLALFSLMVPALYRRQRQTTN